MSDNQNLDRDAVREAERIVMKSIENGWTLDDEVQYRSVEVLAAAAREWLAGPVVTDEMVKRAAKAMHDAAIPEFAIDEIPWEDCHELYQMDRRLAARAALTAALGGEE